MDDQGVSIPTLEESLELPDLRSRIEQLEAQRDELIWYVTEQRYILRKLMVHQLLQQPQVQELIQKQVTDALGRM